MTSRLCIHGHFYQPPRFDPWLEEVLPETSAAPFHDWNQRINRECYLPLAFARRMDSSGRIFNIINCYEYISFNFGPTILSWMERHSPDTYQQILDGDRKSIDHFGRGNAMAQVYHHIIMPLSTDEDRDVEIHWSVADFEHRYGRRPEGMWLAETAVCTQTLEALSRAGIKFTVLAPRQAEAVRAMGDQQWTEVDEQTLDTDQPYLVSLPSGSEMAVFFYDGPLSQAVAFERLLSDGQQFWDRIMDRKDYSFLTLATDGESYGHHFKFGEMALAYVLEQALAAHSPARLTNYASFLDRNSPQREVRIKENTSWSCIHGIERWRENCGCTDGGHPGWNQRWRKPLRRALNLLKYYIDQHYRNAGQLLFKDVNKALLDYGRCLCRAVDQEEFIALHQVNKLSLRERIEAFMLLEMQRAGLASFSSCAWFFDDIARIEPLNSLSYALKGMELLRELKGPDVQAQFLEILEEAYSNNHDLGDGKRIWTDMVVPRKTGPVDMALIGLCLDGQDRTISFPGLKFELHTSGQNLRLEYEWIKTGQKKEKNFSMLDKKDAAGFPLVTDSEAVFSFDSLDRRLKNHVLCTLDQSREDALWKDVLRQASFMKHCLQWPFDEGQKSPQAGLGIMSLGVVFLSLQTGSLSSDFAEYWKELFRHNHHYREVLGQKITLELETLTSGNDPQWAEGADLVSRSGRIGVYPDLFTAQNRLWFQFKETVHPEILRGFFIGKEQQI